MQTSGKPLLDTRSDDICSRRSRRDADLLALRREERKHQHLNGGMLRRAARFAKPGTNSARVLLMQILYKSLLLLREPGVNRQQNFRFATRRKSAWSGAVPVTLACQETRPVIYFQTATYFGERTRRANERETSEDASRQFICELPGRFFVL